jgi:hypothetical protein
MAKRNLTLLRCTILVKLKKAQIAILAPVLRENQAKWPDFC